MQLILNTMLSLKLTKYFKVCFFYCPQKSICFIYPVYFFSFIDLNLNITISYHFVFSVGQIF